MGAYENPQQAQLRSPVYGVVTGQFLGLDSDGNPMVVFPGQQGTAARRARSIANLESVPFGAEVILQFDQGNLNLPIIMGIIQTPQPTTGQSELEPLQVEVDHQHLQIQAQEKLTLRCGQPKRVLGPLTVHDSLSQGPLQPVKEAPVSQ